MRWHNVPSRRQTLTGAEALFQWQRVAEESREYPMPEHVSIAPTIAWQDIEGDLVLFDRSTGGYHALDSISSAIWRAIAGGHSVSSVVKVLSEDYDAPADVIAVDVTRFMEDAMAKGLLIATGATL